MVPDSGCAPTPAIQEGHADLPLPGPSLPPNGPAQAPAATPAASPAACLGAVSGRRVPLVRMAGKAAGLA